MNASTIFGVDSITFFFNHYIVILYNRILLSKATVYPGLMKL